MRARPAADRRLCPREQLTTALYLDKRETVDHYLAVLERLCVEALPTSGSVKLIGEVLDDD
jgi:hypothetical protein